MDSTQLQPEHKYKYAVMLFNTELNLGMSSKPDSWVNYKNIYFDNGEDALLTFLSYRTPYKEVVRGDDDRELQTLMGEKILNYLNEQWKNDNIYNNIDSN